MIKVDVKNILPVTERLQLATLPAASRRRILHNATRSTIKDARQNLKEQRAPDGRPWPKRQQGRRKMLRRMGRGLRNNVTPTTGTVRWRDRAAGKTAAKHQYGLPEIYTKAKARARSNDSSSSAGKNGPATRYQARLMRRLGYSITVGKRVKRVRRPGMAWIEKNMSYEQAGHTIRLLIAEKRDQQTRKSSWEIKVPARPFIAIDTEQVIGAIKEEFNRRR